MMAFDKEGKEVPFPKTTTPRTPPTVIIPPEESAKIESNRYALAEAARLGELRGFDAGVKFASDMIEGIMAADRDVRNSHGWPMDYDTLKQNVETFITGQRNR